MGVFLLFLIIALFWGAPKYKKYIESEYYKITNVPFWELFMDKGKIGEYYTYRYLEKLDGSKKFLFNCYFPTEDGRTTEIDVIMVHESGVYVFESKNYSGWIFGNEEQKNWTQSLPKGKGRSHKTQFLNPIIQNKIHLKWIKKFLEDLSYIRFYSYIIFSDRCELKNVVLTSGEHHVINRYDILREVSENVKKAGKILSSSQVEYIYQKMKPLTEADEEMKAKHIKNIEKIYKQSPKKKYEVIWDEDDCGRGNKKQ